MPIDVRHAVQAALGTVSEFYPNARDARLEEIETPEGKNVWLITLSFLLPREQTPANILVPSLLGNYERVYKIFTVDEETGEVRAMKIRAT
jgi:hypothetical protein